MTSRRASAVALLPLWVLSCTADPGEVLDPRNGPSGIGPVATINLSSQNAMVVGGLTYVVSATLLDAQGREVPGRLVSWSASDATVAAVDEKGSCSTAAVPGCYRTSIRGLRDGTTTVRALVDGISATLTVRVVLAPADASNGFAADFKVIEFDAGQFAPRLAVTEVTGLRNLEVIGLRLTIPGRTAAIGCQGNAVIPAGSRLDMFPITHVGYTLVISSGAARTSDDATATLYLLDRFGTVSKKELSGKVEFGTSPPPVVEAGPSWYCE
jgi:hypothetical protein